MSKKMIVVCNHADPSGIMPSLIHAASGIVLDHEVHMFFTPGGAQALVKGELEKLGTPKGMPNPVELFNTIMDQVPGSCSASLLSRTKALTRRICGTTESSSIKCLRS